MSEIITTLHPQGDNVTNLYPNVKLENIVDTAPEDSGKVLGIGEDGKVKPVTVDIPEPVQVNDSKITLTQGGVEKGFFTLNQADDATIELDASSAGESGSNIYATSSAISKSVPAHIGAATPIKVGDNISELYFNTQQDIGDYLADVVDWGNMEKVRVNDVLSYPILSVTPPSGTVGVKIEVGSYVKGLTTGSRVNIGDKNTALDDILNNMAIENSNGFKVLLKGLINEQNSPVDILQVYKDFDQQIVSLQYKNSNNVWRDLYTTNKGYVGNQWESDDNIPYFNLVDFDNSGLGLKEVIITSIDPSFEPLNGEIFGAYSITGKPVLTALNIPENPDYYAPKPVYMLTSNLVDIFNAQEGSLPLYYTSTDTIMGDGIAPGGWKVNSEFKLTLNSPEVVSKLQPCVDNIASTEQNWVEIPEVYGNIYKENILGTDNIKVDDILIDTKGKFGKVKEITEVSFKNQHAKNPFTINEEITADSALYVDPDASIDFSKFTWDNAQQSEIGSIISLMSTNNGNSLAIVIKMSPIILSMGAGVNVDNPIYMLLIGTEDFESEQGYVSYIKIDPDDAEKIVGSYIEFLLTPKAFNKFAPNGNVETTAEGLYKISLSIHAGSTIETINDQDVWTSAISKDGEWELDEPITKTQIKCGDLANLPKSYNQLTDTPIIKVNSTDVEYQLLPASYINKYVQDSLGFIWFCDGNRFYELTGSSGSGFTVDITTRDGLKKYSASTSDTNYSVTIGLTDASLGNNTSGIDSEYTEVLTRYNHDGTGDADQYAWRSIRAIQPSIQAGRGIEVSGNTVNLTTNNIGVISGASIDMYVIARSGINITDPIGWGKIAIPRDINAGNGLTKNYGDNTDTLSLSQDVQNKLARIPDLPTGDGNYALTCTISGGVATFAWTPAN
ncbi:MAG: hypothetical protein ACI3T9_04630 [Romboutsia timonensis]